MDAAASSAANGGSLRRATMGAEAEEGMGAEIGAEIGAEKEEEEGGGGEEGGREGGGGRRRGEGGAPWRRMAASGPVMVNNKMG